MILAQAGVEYEDNRMKGPEWPSFKPSKKIDASKLIEVKVYVVYL